jgi:hypothetical protein
MSQENVEIVRVGFVALVTDPEARARAVLRCRRRPRAGLHPRNAVGEGSGVPVERRTEHNTSDELSVPDSAEEGSPEPSV